MNAIHLVPQGSLREAGNQASEEHLYGSMFNSIHFAQTPLTEQSLDGGHLVQTDVKGEKRRGI